MEPWKAKQYAGNASITLGLMGAFASFGLFVTRRHDGDTAFKWLGTDDYFVMSALMLGGIFLTWCGRSLSSAGVIDKIKNPEGEKPTYKEVKEADGKIYFELVETKPELAREIDVHIKSACYKALAASIILFTMSSYAFLGGFHSTPTPESNIGPHQNSSMEMSIFCLTYGITAIMSLITLAMSAGTLRSVHDRPGPKNN